MMIIKSTVTLNSVDTEITKRRMGLRHEIVSACQPWGEKKEVIIYQGLPKPVHLGSILLLSISSEFI